MKKESMGVARGGLGSQTPPPLSSVSQVENLGLKLMLCEGIIALKTKTFSGAIKISFKKSFFGRVLHKYLNF